MNTTKNIIMEKNQKKTYLIIVTYTGLYRKVIGGGYDMNHAL